MNIDLDELAHIGAIPKVRWRTSLPDCSWRVYGEPPELREERRMERLAYEAKVAAWKKTPRGMRWMRRSEEISRRNLLLKITKLISSWDDSASVDEKYRNARGLIEWLYDNGYLAEDAL